MVGAPLLAGGSGRVRRPVSAVCLVVLVAAVSVVLRTLPSRVAAAVTPRQLMLQQMPSLDCSGSTIYQISRPSTGSTSGRLNAVAVGAMTGTDPVTAAQATTTLIPAGT